MSAAYAPHDAFVAPARARPEVWRLVAGLVVVGAVLFGLSSAMRAVLYALAPDTLYAELSMDGGTGTTPASALVLLGSFAFMALGAIAAAHHLHGRSALSLIGPSLSRAVRDFFRVLGALSALYIALALLPPWSGPGGTEPQPNLAPGLWAMLLPLTLAALVIQTGAEEILFRGYLQQQLAARFASPLVWLGVPSALFAFGHYVPASFGGDAWLVAVWSGVFGLAMADVTARAGNLGPAIAMHFMNNVFPVAFTAMEGMLSGLALYTLPSPSADPDLLRMAMPVEAGMLLCSWLAARLAIRR
ncbi:CPBP family intramembrane glutamic endopeptidase [Rhodosalinus sp.]|uniref:CPBP family intramembrane glutamic endopeptidase n=1 Tax=Rhodosalinus sp. TaxID=2047741 RepID=UPI00397D3B18